jgi:hypothetical protein
MMNYVRQVFAKNLVANLRTRLLRVLFYPFALVSSKSRPQLSSTEFFNTPEEWNEYKTSNGGLYRDIASRHGKNTDLSMLSPAGQWIFSNRRGESTILDLPISMQEGVTKS